jgi:hypothetical protein
MADELEDLVTGKRTQGQMKLAAQEIIMDSVSVAISYWAERGIVVDGEPTDLGDALTQRERERFHQMLKKQADRVAKTLGYTEAWYS